MMQNREYVKFKMWFKAEGKETADIESIIETLGVEIKTSSISQDMDSFVVEIVALYAWKLVIMDRSFFAGASMVLVGKLED